MKVNTKQARSMERVYTFGKISRIIQDTGLKIELKGMVPIVTLMEENM